MKGFTVALIIFFICIVIAIFILKEEFNEEDFLNKEVIEGIAIKEIILVGVATYVVTFFIFLITIKNDVSEFIEELTYDTLKDGIKFVMHANLHSWKGLIGFFILSTFITAFSFYVIMISTTDVIISIIPGTELVQEAKIECKSLAQALEDFSQHNKFLALLVGPIWVFLLRQIRSYEQRNLNNDYKGARLLVLFLWSVGILFLADNIFELGCIIEREPGLYLPPPSPIYNMYVVFYFAVIYGGPVTGLVYLLDKFIISSIRKKLTKDHHNPE